MRKASKKERSHQPRAVVASIQLKSWGKEVSPLEPTRGRPVCSYLDFNSQKTILYYWPQESQDIHISKVVFFFFFFRNSKIFTLVKVFWGVCVRGTQRMQLVSGITTSCI